MSTSAQNLTFSNTLGSNSRGTGEASPSEFTLPRRSSYNRSSPGRWLFSHGVRYWYLALLNVVGAGGNAILAAVTPIMIGQAFNAIAAKPPQTGALVGIAIWIALTQLARGVLHLARNFGAEWMAQLIERNVRDELYINLLGKSMTFHNLQPVGDIMARATNDVREVNFLFSPGLNLVFGSITFLVMPLIVTPRYHPSLILVPSLFLIGYFIALWQYLHELNPITRNIRQSFGTLNTRLAEALDGIETVKGMSQERNEVTRFDTNAANFRSHVVRQSNIEARFIPPLLLAITQACGILHALLLYRQGIIDLGSVIAYFGILQLFGFPTWSSMWAYSQISLGISGARRILDLMNRENNLDQNLSGNTGQMRGEVEFRDVDFRYDGELTLHNISFHVKPGQTVAIVGQTGSGKTTLVKLINRIYDATSGQILVDGLDVRNWNLETLRRSISIIEQDIFLFSRSISENITFGKQNASQEEIRIAAKAAQADEFITSFQDKYETVVGERGVTLSGGQRQRIALARAFLTDPRILILDDSTSSIDSETEDKIQRAIFTAARGRTTFIITHRLSQIRWADLIILLRQGKIAAIGNHDELMRSSQSYQNIFTEK